MHKFSWHKQCEVLYNSKHHVNHYHLQQQHAWNCYNVSRLSSLLIIIFVSYSTTTLNVVYKTYMQGFAEVINTNDKKGSCGWIVHYATLIIIVVTLFFDTCLLLPFMLTNVIPMFVIYIWMTIIYISVIIYCIASGFLIYEEIEERPEKLHSKKIRHNPRQYETQCCSFIFRPKELPQVALSSDFSISHHHLSKFYYQYFSITHSVFILQ